MKWYWLLYFSINKITEYFTKRRINYLVIHTSDTPEGKNFTIDDIRGWHTYGNGWSDIGYHFVIHLDGSIHKGRDIDTIGAHVKGYNVDSIGICYIGGSDKNGNPKDTRTPSQKRSLNKLLFELKHSFPDAEILGHRDFPNVSKACPSFDAIKEYGWLL